jgi:hypothetical protein
MDLEQPFHPLGIGVADSDRVDMSVFTTEIPSYAAVLDARAGRVAVVRDFLASLAPEDLTAVHKNPWGPHHDETTLSCLHVILDEEWEHHRYATRDLTTLESNPG